MPAVLESRALVELLAATVGADNDVAGYLVTPRPGVALQLVGKTHCSLLE